MRRTNPKLPHAVEIIAGCSTPSALAAVARLTTVAAISRAIAAEQRCQSRSSIIDALKQRLTALERKP